MAKVSVIIPVYNGEKYIKQTLKSVLNQTFQDFEIIVVDDGSTDRSRQRIQSLDDQRIHYFYQANSGCPAIPKNRGIKKAKGKYIAFLDQDDLFLPKKIESQLKLIEGSTPKIDAVICNCFIYNETSKKNIGKNWAKNFRIMPEKISERLIKGNFIVTSSVGLVRKGFFRKNGFLDEKLKIADDYDLWLRLAKDSQIKFISKPLVKWRYHLESLSFSSPKLVDDLVYLYQKVLSRDDLTKKERKIAQQNYEIYLIRKANCHLINGEFKIAERLYKSVNKKHRGYKVDLILKILEISPFLAKSIVGIKKKLTHLGLKPKVEIES